MEPNNTFGRWGRVYIFVERNRLHLGVCYAGGQCGMRGWFLGK